MSKSAVLNDGTPVNYLWQKKIVTIQKKTLAMMANHQKNIDINDTNETEHEQFCTALQRQIFHGQHKGCATKCVFNRPGAFNFDR
jgi:hypothetical protein